MRIAIFLLAFLLPLLAHTEVEAAESVALFNGRDLTGWTHVLKDSSVAASDVWAVDAGVLKCTGQPAGYLRTEQDFENYKLEVEWRWPGKGGNNGVLVHTSTPDELSVWPKSLEVQLASGNAGDFWVIGTEIDAPNEPANPKNRRHIKMVEGAEKPLGEWNNMVIVCQGNEVTVHVNGQLVNRGANSTVTRGAICLQSEGTPIEYRKVELTPLAGAGSGSKPAGSGSATKAGSGKK